MKLLFDENLSFRLARGLIDLFPGSTHVRDVELKAAEDSALWKFAIENDFAVVSKDADMHDRSLVFGYPPKVVWIRLGNCSTLDVERLIRQEIALINKFFDDEFASFLAVS